MPAVIGEIDNRIAIGTANVGTCATSCRTCLAPDTIPYATTAMAPAASGRNGSDELIDNAPSDTRKPPMSHAARLQRMLAPEITSRMIRIIS